LQLFHKASPVTRLLKKIFGSWIVVSTCYFELYILYCINIYHVFDLQVALLVDVEWQGRVHSTWLSYLDRQYWLMLPRPCLSDTRPCQENEKIFSIMQKWVRIVLRETTWLILKFSISSQWLVVSYRIIHLHDLLCVLTKSFNVLLSLKLFYFFFGMVSLKLYIYTHMKYFK
jgi:hypothetical protein